MPIPTLIASLTTLLVGLMLHLVPDITRPGVFFGVTVDPRFRRTEDGQRILRRYRRGVWLGVCGGCVLMLLRLPAAGILVAVSALIWAYGGAHRRALDHATAPAAIREVDLALPAEHLPGGPLVAAGPFVLLAGIGLWAWLNWNQLPERFPVHWGFRGPNRWVTRTPETFLGLLLSLGAACLLLRMAGWALLHGTRRVSTSGPAAQSERRFRAAMLRLLAATGYFVALAALLALLPANGVLVTIWFLALMALLIASMVALMRAGQGGSRLGTQAGAAPAGDRTPDACWKWGLVYINPDDPAILIEKRFGIGYTLNLGNHRAWIALALALLPVFLGVFLLR